ncbi:transcriptional antiterminator RfaH [Rhodovulum bhavnagarense]|uniref:Transcriptional antiterminator RfaH n=1 Tax=Rhodovulum bhavnagarense TaxID=992286 RepID=A0A4R2R9U9_9RHOB|nr:transcription termination/antitermination NusG family protein [Rhodovulum bhavnagarense]TCP58759.1 transcriptional antiterminator RfaH [Rhodovulum bhavnagarense]
MKHAADLASTDWHLLMCRPNQNHIAERSLTRLGFDVFMPRHEVERRWRGRVRTEIRPVFAGYLFLATTPDWPNWHKARSAPGVCRLIGTAQAGPACVPPQIIAGLMSRCDDDGLLRPAIDALSVGDKVRVISGPFRDFVTSVEQIDPDRRIHVLLDLLGRPTRAQLDPEMVMKQEP